MFRITVFHAFNPEVVICLLLMSEGVPVTTAVSVFFGGQNCHTITVPGIEFLDFWNLRCHVLFHIPLCGGYVDGGGTQTIVSGTHIYIPIYYGSA